MAEEVSLAWTAIRGGQPVVDPAGEEWGRVDEVLADREDDIFHGIAVRAGLMAKVREVPAAEIIRITETAITTRIGAGAADALPEYAAGAHGTIELQPPPDQPPGSQSEG